MCFCYKKIPDKLINLVKCILETLDDIWAALDENIQATADEVKRKAEIKQSKSTACGPSPEREIESKPMTNGYAAKEIATSPPPQSISTQVG